MEGKRRIFKRKMVGVSEYTVGYMMMLAVFIPAVIRFAQGQSTPSDFNFQIQAMLLHVGGGLLALRGAQDICRNC